MASARLKISEEAMDAAKSSYDDCVEKMKQLRKNLKKAVEEIRSGWDSDGGKAFLKNLMMSGIKTSMITLPSWST